MRDIKEPLSGPVTRVSATKAKIGRRLRTSLAGLASSRACLMVEPLPLEVPNRSWGTETSLNPYVTTFYMCSVRPRTLSEADVVGSPSRAPTTSGTRFQIYFRTLRGRGTCCGCSRIAGCPRTSPLFRHSSTPSSRIATSSDHQADRERT